MPQFSQREFRRGADSSQLGSHAGRGRGRGVICAAFPHLVRKIDLLLAVHLLFDLALLGQLLQRLHHGLAGWSAGQSGTSGRAASVRGRARPALGSPGLQWPTRGVPRGGTPGAGPHRFAQPVFPLQVPKHILGAVGPVLLLQVLQQDPGGYGRRRHRGGVTQPTPGPLTRSPPGLPGSRGPRTASRRFSPAFTHGLSRRQTPKAAGRYSCSGQRLLPAAGGAGLVRRLAEEEALARNEADLPGPRSGFLPGARTPRTTPCLGVCRGGGAHTLPTFPCSPRNGSRRTSRLGLVARPPPRLSRAEGSDGKPRGQLPLGRRPAQGHSAVTVTATC